MSTPGGGDGGADHLNRKGAHLKTESISLKRRTLMIAGAVTAVSGGAIYTAAQHFGARPATRVSATAGSSLLASGRIVTPDGKPLAGASVLAWYVCAPMNKGDNEHCQVTTDADGRFVFNTVAPGVSADGIQPMRLYVTHPDIEPHHAQVSFERGRDDAHVIHAQTLLDRDTLRASFGLTVG